jgi:SAM-dependent methyltransferase
VRLNLAGRRDLVVLDVGAGEKPYQPVFEPYIHRYVALDYRPRPLSTDIAAVSEELPMMNGTVDVVLGTQMLEHVSSPANTLHEWRRVLRPGGLVFASTHGTFSYHPDPTDYWRWTHAGLRKLFEDAQLEVLSIEACGGNLSSYTTLLGSDAQTRFLALGLGRPFSVALGLVQSVVERLDPITRRRTLHDDFPGGLPTNFLVVGRRPQQPSANGTG